MRKLILIILPLIFMACASTDSPQPVEDNTNYPDTQLDDATIVFTEDGVQSVLVEAEHIDRWQNRDSTEADMVNLHFYDEKGVEQSSLTANRGLIREKTEKVSVFGNVIAINEDSTILRTESLLWDPETQLISTDDYVEVERANGDILTGYGLKGDRNLQELEILRDVKGKVLDIPEEEKETFNENE